MPMAPASHATEPPPAGGPGVSLKALLFPALCVVPLLSGCRDEPRQQTGQTAAPSLSVDSVVAVLGPAEHPIPAEELERGRLDPSWKAVVQLDSASPSRAARSPERWEDISAETANRGPMYLPVAGDVAGPSVLRVQTLLDRAFFSPGILDGRWGKNVEKAVYWVQRREGLRATGQVDSATFARLVRLAGNPPEIVRRHRLTEEDVRGPFLPMPEEIYEAHRLRCTCYESLSEKLGERFHTSPELLARLNPGVDLDALVAGREIRVPAVRDSSARAEASVAEIVVSVRGHYLHARDADGRILYHFPTTLGSGYNPGEGTAQRVMGIAPNPWWNLQPRLLHVGDPTRPDVRIPPGPNSAVGNMWIDLSKPHYGIHGTAEPQTIGYAVSSGCVRLTNWDARFLGSRIRRGVPVRFRDIPPGQQEHPSHGGDSSRRAAARSADPPPSRSAGRPAG